MRKPPFFFYGTLIDPDVLAAVVGRRVPPGDRQHAEAEGWRRVFRDGATYPVLVPAEGGRVDGVLVAGLGRPDVERLSRFEGPDYRLSEIDVRPRTPGRIRARVFLPKPGVPATKEEWTIDAWRRRHRGRYLARLRANLAAD